MSDKLMRGYKNIDKLLKLLETMYLEGAFSKQCVMELLDESFRSSEGKLLDLVKNFGDQHIKYILEDDKKFFYAGYDFFRDLYNYLMKIYYLKTTTSNRLKGYFLILHLLNKKPGQETSKLLDALADEGFEFNDSTIRKLLQDMVSHGVIKYLVEGNRHCYYLADDSLQQLSDQELLDLYRALSFFSNSEFPYAVGDLTKRNLEMYMAHYRHIDYPDIDYFHVINKGFHLTLYEELFVDLLDAIEHGQEISAYLDGEQIRFIPSTFQLDVDLGELYLIGHDHNGQNHRIRVYQWLHSEEASVEPLPKRDVDRGYFTIKTEFNKEEFQIFRLRALYPKAKLTIHNAYTMVDVSQYSREKIIEILLEQLPIIESIDCDPSIETQLRKILEEGSQHHATI
jgi:DNA-binding PadR family transcriptional regulator